MKNIFPLQVCDVITSNILVLCSFFAFQETRMLLIVIFEDMIFASDTTCFDEAITLCSGLNYTCRGVTMESSTAIVTSSPENRVFSECFCWDNLSLKVSKKSLAPKLMKEMCLNHLGQYCVLFLSFYLVLFLKEVLNHKTTTALLSFC